MRTHSKLPNVLTVMVKSSKVDATPKVTTLDMEVIPADSMDTLIIISTITNMFMDMTIMEVTNIIIKIMGMDMVDTVDMAVDTEESTNTSYRQAT